MTTFATSRQFADTPTAVFAAIKDPARLARWWGPNGFSNHFEIFDFQSGGKWALNMISPEGTTYPNESIFSSIEVDRKVVIDHLSQPHFTLTITLEPNPDGTLVYWCQEFEDAALALSIRHIVEPANEQNLDRLSVELGLSDPSRD